MSSTAGRSSTTDEFDVEDSTYDRDSVNPNYQRGEDGEESTHNSASFLHLSFASGSSFDSRTYGTSTYISGGSETLERDGFSDEEFGDLDNLSLESQPMAMDRWVDSTCSCLDYPALVYQKMCMQTETSLLRESEGIPRSTFSISNSTNSPTNLGIAAAKRRNLRREGKATPNDGKLNDNVSSMRDERKNEIRKMPIQPKKHFDFNDVESSERERGDSQTPRKKEPEELVATATKCYDDASRLEKKSMREKRSEDSEKKKTNEEAQSISNGSTESMLERAIQKAAKEDEERDIKMRLSETFNDVDAKLDPPSHTETENTREGKAGDSYLTNRHDIESSTSKGPIEGSPKKEKEMVEFPDDPSGRGQRSPLLPVIKQTTSVYASQQSDSAQRIQESHEAKSTTSSMEIIDVISIDDQDSWTPGSRNEIDRSTKKLGENRHSHSQDSSRPDDPSISSIHVSSPKAHDQHHDRHMTTDSSTVDELCIEEEAKLNMRISSNRSTSTASKDLAGSKSAEALWNEERMKLQTISDVVVRSQSRRQLIQKVLEGTGREDYIFNPSTKNFRSTSAGRRRPSSDTFCAIEQSRSREQSLVSQQILLQQGSKDSLSNLPLSPRSKDLVAIRSIEEAQRIRSSKRDKGKYSIPSHYESDRHSYTRESSSRSPYDEHSKANIHQPEIDHMIRSLSLQKSRNRDPTGRRGHSNVEGPAKKYIMSDERDDQESLPSSPPIGNKHPAAHVGNNWSGYDTAVSATKELRQLEKKIERQIRRADADPQIDQSKEKRRMEKKLSKKLRSIIKSDDTNAQKLSSKEIRKLEKHLAQTLNGENETRASKLKRVKHKEKQRFTQAQHSHSTPHELQQSDGYPITHSHLSKALLQESRDQRPERSRYEELKGLRSRYARRGIGRRSYSRMSDSD